LGKRAVARDPTALGGWLAEDPEAWVVIVAKVSLDGEEAGAGAGGEATEIRTAEGAGAGVGGHADEHP
jgi:hypothetical protein